MAKRLHVDPDAWEELSHAARTLDDSRALGDTFLAEFERITAAIRETPERFAPLLTTSWLVVRSKRIARFRYRVVFVDLPTFVWVVAVPHERRKPGYWIARLDRPPTEPSKR